jgi:ferredoxin
MRVTLDVPRCTGHARCNAIAPQVYALDDDGYSALTDLTVPAADQQAARDGAASCPERALTISD